MHFWEQSAPSLLAKYFLLLITYNTHKKRNYVKIMMGVSTDSTIICALGPFKARDNDATIIKKMFAKDEPVLSSYHPMT